MLRPIQPQRRLPLRPPPLTFRWPAAVCSAGSASPVQISVSARTVDSTITSSSCRGRRGRGRWCRLRPPATTAARRAGASVKRKWITTRRSAGKLLEPREPAYVPHQEAGVELVLLQAAADPARAPVTEADHQGAQLFACLRQVVLPRAFARLALGRCPTPRACAGAWSTASADIRGTPRRISLKRRLPHSNSRIDEGRPQLAQYLGTARHRAELPVVGHGNVYLGRARNSRIWT